MKKLCLFGAAAVIAVAVSSCGSTWSIEGNNMTIIKCDTDTIAPAGSFIMLPEDSTINE